MDKMDSRGIYCYPGCLEGRGFDECEQKGFVVLDIDMDTLKANVNFDLVMELLLLTLKEN